jgi:hypothetical protein
MGRFFIGVSFDMQLGQKESGMQGRSALPGAMGVMS